MVKAAKKIALMEKELLNAPISPMIYNQKRHEIDEAIRQLGEKNDRYLDKKKGDRGVQNLDDLTGKNPYEQARIDHSLKIKKFVDAYQQPRALRETDLEKMNEQDAREFRIASELGEMQDKQQAFKLLSEFHKAHGMAAPELISKEIQDFRGAYKAGEKQDQQQSFKHMAEIQKKFGGASPEEMLSQRRKELEEQGPEEPENGPIIAGP